MKTLYDRLPFSMEIDDELNTCLIYDNNSNLVCETNDNAWAEFIVELSSQVSKLNQAISMTYKNKLKQRDIQIADLKHRLKEAENKVTEEANDLYNLMHTIREMDYAKQDNDTKRYDYWNRRLGQIIHIQPYGKIKQ